jgi:hypothetical protein
MDYAALPSPLVLVAAARSSTTPWEAPTGPETNRTPKELRHIGNYVKIKAAWDLVFRLGALLEFDEPLRLWLRENCRVFRP